MKRVTGDGRMPRESAGIGAKGDSWLKTGPIRSDANLSQRARIGTATREPPSQDERA